MKTQIRHKTAKRVHIWVENNMVYNAVKDGLRDMDIDTIREHFMVTKSGLVKNLKTGNFIKHQICRELRLNR